MHDAAGKALELRLEFPDGLPEMPEFEPGIRRAPNRGQVLNDKEVVLALKNALRYIPEKYHKELAPEFLKEYQEHPRVPQGIPGARTHLWLPLPSERKALRQTHRRI